MTRKGRRQRACRDVFVDSSGWLALLHARDQRHRDADRAVRSAVARRIPLFTTNLVIAEVHRLLLHRVGSAAAGVFLDRVDVSNEVEIEYATANHHAATRACLTKLSDQTITYADAVSFAAMDARGCRSALSFDRDFVIAGFALFRASDSAQPSGGAR